MSNPVAVLNKPKMAVFHVEEAILDNAAGERIAKRKGLSGKRFEREVASNVEKAVSRAGVRDYVNKLSRDGYTIAFITNMEPTYKSCLQARLRDLGYPSWQTQRTTCPQRWKSRQHPFIGKPL